MSKPKIIYTRCGMLVESEMAPVRLSVTIQAQADLTVSPAVDAQVPTRYVKPLGALLDPVTSGSDVILGVSGSPIFMDVAVVDADDVLLQNLPPNTGQILSLIQQELASIQMSPVTTYDDLPDPGSFLPVFLETL